jgi:pimeloyl-ACP methyl ester carboxylesterase
LVALSATSGYPVSENEADEIEAGGFILTGQTAADIRALDALTMRPNSQRVLIVARDDLSDDQRLLSHLSQQGMAATQICQPGYADMMTEPHNTKVPRDAIAAIADWLGQAVGNDRNQTSWPKGLVEAKISEAIVEKITLIGERPGLFAILTEPIGAKSRDLPLIVLLNGGAAYRIGPNRLYVLMARALVGRGFRVMRVDLGGLGDSVASDPRLENDPYASTVFSDINRVITSVQSILGIRRIVLLGLCSGAYAAFQAAAQFSNPALVESVLVNPLTYFWAEGMSLAASPVNDLKASHYYMTAFRKPSKWLKFFSGRTQIGLLGAIKVLANRWRRRPLKEVTEVGTSQFVNDAAVTHPRHYDLPGDLGCAVWSGRHLACFFSRSDPGYSILTFHAAKLVKELCHTGKMNVFFVENADHTFTRRSPRREVIRAVVEYLCKRYQDDANRGEPVR